MLALTGTQQEGKHGGLPLQRGRAAHPNRGCVGAGTVVYAGRDEGLCRPGRVDIIKEEIFFIRECNVCGRLWTSEMS